jgi:hypothetical protein
MKGALMLIKHAVPYAIGISLLVALLKPAPAQERKPSAAQQPKAAAPEAQHYYKKPETTAEFWRYMNHEIEVGQYKVAAGYLNSFIAKNPSDEELLQIQEAEGSSAFLRLLTIPELRDEAKPLVERVDALVRKHLADRKRLDALIQNLEGSPEERAYAISQFRRSGAAAVPALVDALLRTSQELEPHAQILSVLPRLGKEALPPLVAALEVNDDNLRTELIQVLQKRGDVAAAPFLWYYAASPRQPEMVRKAASAALAYLLGLRPDRLLAAKVALTQEAERYYEHKVALPRSDGLVLWRWDGKQLTSQTVTASQAEEYYGLRFARQALELDPNSLRVQIVFLSLALDKGMVRAGLDQPLSKGAQPVKDLLASVNPELVIAVLQRALEDGRLAVILASVRALGDHAERRAAYTDGRTVPVLFQALDFPDRRVQMAAADALLRIPGSGRTSASARVVEVLRRMASANASARVIVADGSPGRGNAIAKAVKDAGYDAVVVQFGRDLLHRLAQAADVDAVLIDADIADPQLPFVLAQVRSDIHNGLVPVLVMTTSDRIPALQRQLERYPHTWVIQGSTDAKELKGLLNSRIAEAAGKALTPVERKDHAARAMEWLARLARGEAPGFDIRPAEAAILSNLRSKELAALAVEAAEKLPSRAAQRALATVVLEADQPEALRSAAAIALSHNIQQNGLVLSAEQTKRLGELFQSLGENKLKGNVALVLGSLRPDTRETGERLQRYTPVFQAPAPPPKATKGAVTGEDADK